MHIVQVVNDLLQHHKPGPPVVHTPRSVVMNQPSPLIRPHHGDVAVDHTVSLVGEVLLDLRALLVYLLVGSFEILSVILDQAILARIDKTRLEKEFPQGLHVDLTSDISMGVKGTGKQVGQTAVCVDIHVQNGEATTNALSLFLRAIDDLGRTLHPHGTGKIDYHLRDDHPLQENPLVRLLVDGKPRGRDIRNL